MPYKRCSFNHSQDCQWLVLQMSTFIIIVTFILPEIKEPNKIAKMQQIYVFYYLITVAWIIFNFVSMNLNFKI